MQIRGGGGALGIHWNIKRDRAVLVSVRLTNPGYSQVVEEAFTFILE
ncbi:MAG: hypothetical protein ACLU4J_13875 [Butyricimonas paravirosa]